MFDVQSVRCLSFPRVWHEVFLLSSMKLKKSGGSEVQGSEVQGSEVLGSVVSR
jgi:hypothetical protein